MIKLLYALLISFYSLVAYGGSFDDFTVKSYPSSYALDDGLKPIITSSSPFEFTDIPSQNRDAMPLFSESCSNIKYTGYIENQAINILNDVKSFILQLTDPVVNVNKFETGIFLYSFAKCFGISLEEEFDLTCSESVPGQQCLISELADAIGEQSKAVSTTMGVQMSGSSSGAVVKTETKDTKAGAVISRTMEAKVAPWYEKVAICIGSEREKILKFLNNIFKKNFKLKNSIITSLSNKCSVSLRKEGDPVTWSEIWKMNKELISSNATDDATIEDSTSDFNQSSTASRDAIDDYKSIKGLTNLCIDGLSSSDPEACLTTEEKNKFRMMSEEDVTITYNSTKAFNITRSFYNESSTTQQAKDILFEQLTQVTKIINGAALSDLTYDIDGNGIVDNLDLQEINTRLMDIDSIYTIKNEYSDNSQGYNVIGELLTNLTPENQDPVYDIPPTTVLPHTEKVLTDFWTLKESLNISSDFNLNFYIDEVFYGVIKQKLLPTNIDEIPLGVEIPYLRVSPFDKNIFTTETSIRDDLLLIKSNFGVSTGMKYFSVLETTSTYPIDIANFYRAVIKMLIFANTSSGSAIELDDSGKENLTAYANTKIVTPAVFNSIKGILEDFNTNSIFRKYYDVIGIKNELTADAWKNNSIVELNVIKREMFRKIIQQALAMPELPELIIEIPKKTGYAFQSEISDIWIPRSLGTRYDNLSKIKIFFKYLNAIYSKTAVEDNINALSKKIDEFDSLAPLDRSRNFLSKSTDLDNRENTLKNEQLIKLIP